MTNAYSYIRFSTPEQLKGDSLRRQLENSRQYCQANGLKLNEGLRDLGVSAFKGKNRMQGALSRFIQLVNTGTIAPKSVLIVESIDRLSREQLLTALNLFTSILEAGIKIVTLLDKKEYTAESVNANPMDLMYSIMIMGRANEESTTKGKRVAAAWEAKQRKAATTPMGERCPGWIRLAADRKSYVLIPEYVQVVRKAIELSLTGNGCTAIVKILNADGICFGNAAWSSSTVHRMLCSRTLVGEYQPMHHVAGKKIPNGNPVPNYYPAVINESEWSRLQAAMKSRIDSQSGGRGNEKISNLFGKLLWDRLHQSTVGVMYRTKSHERILHAYKSRTQAESKAKFVALPYDFFETGILKLLPELNNIDEPRINGKLPGLRDRQADLINRIAAVQHEMESGDIHSLAAVLVKLESQLRQVNGQIETEQASLQTPPVDNDEFAGKVRQMWHEKDPAKLYALRAAIRQQLVMLVEKIEIDVRMIRQPREYLNLIHDGLTPNQIEDLPGKRVDWRQCIAQIQMRNGRKRIAYMLICATRNPDGTQYSNTGWQDNDAADIKQSVAA